MMHKQILRTAIALAAAGLAAQAAHAQSSVTLYGIVDAGFTFTNNQKGEKAYQATQGNVQGSRWGLIGSEDLGGGNKVMFKLENGFSRNGCVGAGWPPVRPQRMGCALQQQGGHDHARPSVQQRAGLSVEHADQWRRRDEPVGNAIYDNDDINNTYRTNNAVKYTTPTYAGFTANAMYAFSNTAGEFANNRAWSVGADYVNGPAASGRGLLAGQSAGYQHHGRGAVDNYYSTSSSIISGVKRNQVWGAGGSYVFGPATVLLLYTNSQFQLLSGGSLRFANYEASVKYQLTPAALLALGYIYTTQNTSGTTATNAHYNQLSVGGEYFLSKTTDLYLNGIYQHASGSHAWVEGISNPSSNSGQFVTVAGIRHKF
jgi:Outer membrane protein (porin)